VLISLIAGGLGKERNDAVSGTSCEERLVRVEAQATNGTDALSQEPIVIQNRIQFFAFKVENLDLLALRPTVEISHKRKESIRKKKKEEV
jgi:hypothetical protein